jgi:meiotically up-regulated gene 157 (Mug157) protein
MAKRCGLSKGYFRPSDDAVTFSYHIPSQAMMVVEVGLRKRSEKRGLSFLSNA